ncbi:MAG: hypothetical protein M0Z66_08255 [Thermaerobacter sp.]|nr:hypothetical protein [Thermaerobacter sp.]
MAGNPDRPERHGRSPASFGKRLLLSLAVIAVVGAAVLIRSGSTPRKIDPTIAKPKAVLFAVRGTPTDSLGPGFAAFIAVIRPSKHDIGIIPVPGSLPTADGQTLAEIAPTASGQAIANDVVSQLHVQLSGYLVIDADTVEYVLTKLWDQAPSWPPDLTPSQSLADLGWPNANAPRKASITVIQDLIQYLPEIPGNGNLLVAAVLQGSITDLSPYEMFVLVTYINDERITPLTVRSLPASVREKQVKH